MEIPAVGTYTGSPAHNNTEEIPGEAWWSATATCDGAEIYKSQFGWQTSPEFKFYAKSTTPKKYTMTITLYLTISIYKKNRDGTKGEFLRHSPPSETPILFTFTREIWIVGIDRIEVKPADKQDDAYITSPNEVVALVGSNCVFRAIRTPADAPAWPSGKPVWQSTKGPMVADTFFENETTARTSLIQCECGNTITKNLTKIKPELQSVDFKNGGVQTIEDVGTEPEWKKADANGRGGRDEPFCVVKNQTYNLIGTFTFSKKLTFPTSIKICETDDTKSTAVTAIVQDSIAVTRLRNAPNKVSYDTLEFKWQYTVNNGQSWHYLTTPNKHIMYTTWNQKLCADADFTKGHIHYACTTANGAITLTEIGDKIGPDATSRSRFSGNRNRQIVLTHDLSKVWEIIDKNKKADCGTLSTLMKATILLLGDETPKVKFVMPRHKSWKGLESDSSWDSEKRTNFLGREIEGSELGFITSFYNYYEGCCLFQEKWWIGGVGQSKNSAYEVLILVTFPNNSPNKGRQVWRDRQRLPVPYPSGKP